MMLVIDHQWAIPFRNAMRAQGGILISQDFLSPEALIALGAEIADEGCLSFPGINLDIDRAERATVEWLDLDGRRRTQTFEGLLARVILHECEHLDGRVFLDNVSVLKRELVKKQIRKRIKSGDWVEAALS